MLKSVNYLSYKTLSKIYFYLVLVNWIYEKAHNKIDI